MILATGGRNRINLPAAVRYIRNESGIAVSRVTLWTWITRGYGSTGRRMDAVV